MKSGTKKAVKSAAKAPVETAQTKTVTTTKPLVSIEAKIDVGFGNQLFVRGEGAGLSWERGTPLKCVGGNSWQWATESGSPLKCKLLLNDAVWMAGEDLVVPPGKRLEITPAF